MGQEHVLDPELLGEPESRRDRPSLEEHRAIEQQTRKMARRRGSALTAEHLSSMARTIAKDGVKAR